MPGTKLKYISSGLSIHTAQISDEIFSREYSLNALEYCGIYSREGHILKKNYCCVILKFALRCTF